MSTSMEGDVGDTLSGGRSCAKGLKGEGGEGELGALL
jgi:hypothetical protein